jgi:ABC-2 type transport system ATP-binding protein
MDGDALPTVNSDGAAVRDDTSLVVCARGLAKRYGAVDAVQHLDLSVRQGEIYGFLGPNGAGKTTTLLMLLGIERPTAGELSLFGQPSPPDPFRDKVRIGVVGEQQYLYDDLSAWEYLLFFGQLYRVDRPERRAQELLERLDLDQFRRLRARDFSRGMQQKLGLARALLHRPELLILDEPVSGLDPHGIRQVREILTDENHRGTTILLSSHILSEIERTAHRVGILYGGRLVAEDDVARLSARLEPDVVLEIDVEQLRPGLMVRLGEESFVHKIELSSNGIDHGQVPRPDHGLLRVYVANDGDYRRDVAAIVNAHGGLITGLRQERLSLEEAFVRLTSEESGVRSQESEGVTTMSPPPRAGEGAPCSLLVQRPTSDVQHPTSNASTAHSLLATRPLTVWTIARRDVLGMLHGPGVYLVVALGMLATLPVVSSYLDAVERSRVLVLADAFTLPFFVATTLAMLFLALASVATVAREKEQGTLETLFYGPVDVASYVLAKHLAQVVTYLPIGLGLYALMLAYSGITGLRLPSAFGLELLLSVSTAAAVTALGICLSTLVRGARNGIALFLGLTGLFLVIRLAAELLSGIPVTNSSSPLLLLRNVMLALDTIVGYVSPFSVLQSGIDALVRGDALGYVEALAISCGQCVLLLLVSVRLLGRRGVRR